MGWYDSVMVREGWYFMADFWGDIREYFRESEEPSKSQELSRVDIKKHFSQPTAQSSKLERHSKVI